MHGGQVMPIILALGMLRWADPGDWLVGQGGLINESRESVCSEASPG